jgi:activator of HSP90 ATPase
MKQADIERIGQVSTASVHKGSGKHWREWINILDRAGAGGWTHQEIVAFLKKKYKLRPWWQQGVTIGYEIHTGKRVPGQTLKGDYSVTSTKAFAIDAKSLWKLVSSAKGIDIWLQPLSSFSLRPKSQYEVAGGIFGEVRTMKAPQRIRMTWQDSDWEKPTTLQINVYPKKGKSMLVIQHEHLKTASLKEEMRKRWRRALEKLLIASKQESR